MVNTLKVSIGSYSDKGQKSQNEDFFGAIIPQEPQLTLKGIAIAIADGMSGSDAGMQASQSCVGGFLHDYYSTPDSWTVTHSGQKILSATNLWLYCQGKALHASIKGMVTTLSSIILKSNTAHLFHVGDSRIYRLRKMNLELMTQDHRVWVSKDKNYLNRAVGIEPHLEIDYKSFPLEKGDRFIMTTDGVHDYIDEKVIRQCAANGNELDHIAESIVKHALNNRSDDNLTCQVVQIDELPQLKEHEIMRRFANLPFPPALEKGMVLDGYQIQAELHASKRTQIYQAYDTLHKCNVILKTPSVLYDDDTVYIEQFLHEEWAAKRIQHDNVLSVVETDRNKTCLYYVTEFIEGQTLRDWMKLYPKPDLTVARNIIEQIAKGLRAFHRKEMLHQDLKPENIMITTDGTAKIIDFGSVKIAGIAEITQLDLGSGENVLGTLNYTAPEYHLRQRGSNQSDLYSLGVIAYELLNGSLPFGDMPERPNRINLSRLEYVPSIRKNPMVPIWIDGALRKATSISTQLRYEALSEFIFDLKTPNPKFLQAEDRLPLMQRNPVSFWQGVAGLLLLLNFILIYLLNR